MIEEPKTAMAVWIVRVMGDMRIKSGVGIIIRRVASRRPLEVRGGSGVAWVLSMLLMLIC